VLPFENPANAEAAPASIPRPPGRTCRTYAELVDAIAVRVIELNVQHLEIDHKAGLASGHTGKLLGPRPLKFYGPISLDLHLQVLGLRSVVEPDPERPSVLIGTREFRPRDPATVLAARVATREGRELLAVLAECAEAGSDRDRRLVAAA
jgi:hypothetical protein